MLKTAERYIIAVIRGKRTGFLASCTRACLRITSWFFQLAVYVRNWAYDHKILSRHYPPVPIVVSIGNIVAGGTGKTPVTMMLAKAFYEDTTIAILTRGYRSPVEKMPTPIVLSKGNGPIYPANYCGDEPFLLSNNLPKALVFVGRNRALASNMAARSGAELLLLDDGMQHRRLARDLEVVVVDALDPFGQGYFLPRGFLRESMSALSRADLIILNHASNEELFQKRKQEIDPYSKAPLVGAQLQITGIFDLQDQPAPSLANRPVAMFCGIAHPDSFAQTIESIGAEIVARYDFPDHLGFDREGLMNYATSCQRMGAEYLICTEKDKVKVDPSWPLPLPLVWIKISLEIVYGHEHWLTFVQKIRDELLYRK